MLKKQVKESLTKTGPFDFECDYAIASKQRSTNKWFKQQLIANSWHKLNVLKITTKVIATSSPTNEIAILIAKIQPMIKAKTGTTETIMDVVTIGEETRVFANHDRTDVVHTGARRAHAV